MMQCFVVIMASMQCYRMAPFATKHYRYNIHMLQCYKLLQVTTRLRSTMQQGWNLLMPVTTGHFSHLVFCGHRTFLLYCLNSRPARSRGKLYGYAPSQQFNPFYSNGAKIRPWHTLQVKMLICLTPFSEGRKLNSNVSRFALYLLPSAKDLLAFDSQRLQNGKGLPSHKLRPRFTMQLITHLT